MTTPERPASLLDLLAHVETNLPDGVEAYPCGIGVYCDECGITVSHDYLVHTGMTKADRLNVARKHLTENEGWSAMGGVPGGEDLCPRCLSCQCLPASPAAPRIYCDACLAAGAGPAADEDPEAACLRAMADEDIASHPDRI